MRLVLRLLFLVGGPLAAQVRVNPTGVNVHMMQPTTVFLTFGGVRANLRPAEAFWCGEVVPATPDIGVRCRPGTIFGQLPARYDLSRASGATGFTDIMSIPASVVRRAWQDAQRGAIPSFFYVRRFVNVAGGRDEYVSVTCRPSAGGARTPFALTDVRMHFVGGDDVAVVPAGQPLQPFVARIQYTGTGRLVGRWEVVMPGEEAPGNEDLLTEATLPLEARGGQVRYTQLERFNLFVAPGGTLELPGPDPARLPTNTEGLYQVLLRVEATDDREGDSNLGTAGAGQGLVHAGAVAGFPMPVLRYVVRGDGSASARGTPRLTLLAPREGAALAADSALRLRWSGLAQASYYRVEVETVDGRVIAQALIPSGLTRHDVPAVLLRETNGSMRWRVVALDATGALWRRTSWRHIERKP